jgi:hypothetical protein
MKCAALFVDLSKAFDTVDHDILLNKLSSIGLSSDACSWFHDYLSDRTQAIVIDGVKKLRFKVGFFLQIQISCLSSQQEADCVVNLSTCS